MPRKTQLSTEAIRHIASGEIGIHAAKTKYGIGEQRVLRIRQGLEQPQTSTAQASDAKPNNGTTTANNKILELEAENKQLREALEKSQQRQESDTDRILELEAKNDDLAELHHAPIRKLQ